MFIMFYICKLVTLLNNSIRPDPDPVELHEEHPSSGDSLSTNRSSGSVISQFLIFHVLYKYCVKQILHCRAVPPNCSAQSPDTASASCINQSIKGRGTETEVSRPGPAIIAHAMGLCSSPLERTKSQQCPAPARQKRSHQTSRSQ